MAQLPNMELNSTQQNRRTTEKRRLTTDRGRRKAYQRNEARSQENAVSGLRERGGGNKDEAKKSALLVQMLKGNPPLQSFPKLLLILALNHGQKPLSSSRLLEKIKAVSQETS